MLNLSDGLIPFTRWITPTNIPKRFTTQMYLYLLPISQPPSGPLSASTEAMIPIPTHDGGVEHTAARFLYPAKWLELARSGEIILFPPQYFLLHLIAPFLEPPAQDAETLGKQRRALLEFVKSGDPPWGDMCISPQVAVKSKVDGRAVLGLDKPGPELQESHRRGDSERVIYVDFRKEGPRDVEVRWRKEAFERERMAEVKL